MAAAAAGAGAAFKRMHAFKWVFRYSINYIHIISRIFHFVNAFMRIYA